MVQKVIVRLRRPTRVQVFTARGVVLSPGDACIVRTEQGLEFGTCMAEPEDCTEEEVKGIAQPVVRRATSNDQLTFQQILKEEERAFELCARKIRERNLSMQLVDVEYTFDRHKITFRFTAEERVDFRDLVRELAHELKARIELQHIQVRDKAKTVGGFAACGRELCCATWLTDFMPISMKMAKRQNLSLNPAKISGQCGRLMCCLSYENANYEDPKKKKAAAVPDAASDPETADGDPEEIEAMEKAEPDVEEAAADSEESSQPVASGLPGNEKPRGKRKKRRRRK
ncbi:MAG TPA: regulatory iron-sulfur-containing complex subunit RicT [Candidatus Hydrogenedentes bacterium]|nr:regulatory iron-sulfur-containing complex subunit RicT [Candidatus Hydrogenedentota bacterium]